MRSQLGLGRDSAGMRVYSGLDVRSDFGGRLPWTSRYIDRAGVKQAYLDEGPRDADVTIVCVHGNPTWSYLYREFVRRLAHRYRVIAPDHVGFGRSDKPRDPAYYSIGRHIANLAELLQKARARNVVLVVHDWGGPIGIGWAVRHPDDVAGLVILNTSAFVEPPVPNFYRGWKRELSREHFIEDNYFVETFVGVNGTSRTMTDDDLDPYRAPFPTPNDRVGIARMPNIWERDDSGRETYDEAAATESGLSRLRLKPALICWGARDKAFSQLHLARWRAAFDDVDGPHVMEDASHFVQEDAPKEILDQMERWLAERITR